MRGPRHHLWKGGGHEATEQHAFYHSGPWLSLCRVIWRRDAGTCGNCLLRIVKVGGHAVHHIGGWVEFPDLRLEPTNLVLVCASCHRWIHSQANATDKFIRRPVVE